MKGLLKIATALTLLILIGSRNQIKEYLNFETVKNEPPLIAIDNRGIEGKKAAPKGDYLVNDSLYRWDEVALNWITVKPNQKRLEQAPKPMLTSLSTIDDASNKPIKIDWSLLMEIEYNLKYYQAFEMKIYAPVFTESLIALDGKEVIIEGFVIPLDESGDLVALSANPYASCFFCGKASPASVMSLYLKKKKLYKIDDFRKFRGTLKLNHNDPEEYYFILENAVPKR